MKSPLAASALALVTLAACTDAPTVAPDGARAVIPGSIVDDNPGLKGEVGSSVRWNRTSIALFRARGGAAGRINAYLSLAQYRAILTARDARHGMVRPSLAAA